jgi:hypothetical protein
MGPANAREADPQRVRRARVRFGEPSPTIFDVKMRMAGVLTMAAVAAGASPALAQTGGGSSPVGTVDSSLELILAQPSGLSTFKKSGTYTLSVKAMATTSGAATKLSVADGDATHGSKLGYMTAGSKRLKDPLQARVGSLAFQPLSASLDPLLASWSGPFSRKPVTVDLRQTIRGTAKGTYHKLVLVTLSSETP